MEKTANLFWVSIILWSPYFCSCLFCGRQCCKTSICISCCRLANSLSNSCWTDSCWFSSISPSAMFAESINDFTISFGVFSLLITLFKRGMHWSSSIFTVLRSWLLESIVFPVYLHFISKQVKIESRKAPRGKKSPRHEVSETNFCFDESTVLFFFN